MLKLFENIVKLATYCLIKPFSTKYSILDRIPSKDDVWKMDMNYLKYTYLGRGNMVETMEITTSMHIFRLFFFFCVNGVDSLTLLEAHQYSYDLIGEYVMPFVKMHKIWSSLKLISFIWSYVMGILFAVFPIV